MNKKEYIIALSYLKLTYDLANYLRAIYPHKALESKEAQDALDTTRESACAKTYASKELAQKDIDTIKSLEEKYEDKYPVNMKIIEYKELISEQKEQFVC